MRLKEVILLNYTDNVRNVEMQEKLKFLLETFLHMSLPEEELEKVFGGDIDLSVEQKLELKKILNKYNIRLDYTEGLDIYLDEELIAQWHKPIYILKRDFSKERKKQLYLEMTIEKWSIFESEQQ